MFETGLQESTGTRAKIEQLESAMLESLKNMELFSSDADQARADENTELEMACITAQQTCGVQATAYGAAALALRAKMTAGELQ